MNFDEWFRMWWPTNKDHVAHHRMTREEFREWQGYNGLGGPGDPGIQPDIKRPVEDSARLAAKAAWDAAMISKERR